MILGQLPEWNESAASLLKQYLESGSGQLFLAHLTTSRPSLLAGSSDVNAVALRASEAAGFERALSQILSLSEPPPKSAGPGREQYPSLDDETAWDERTNTPL